MHPAIGVFGKLPAQGDFVAHRTVEPVVRGFEAWLQTEVDQCAAKNVGQPSTTTRFFYRDPEGSGALIGAMAPSRDAVGRRFPIAVFVSVPGAAAAESFPWLPAAYAQFLEAAVALLQSTGSMPAAELVTAAQELPRPDDVALEQARTWTLEALEATSGQAILEALFGPAVEGVRYHGINMFSAACRRVRGHERGFASIILECPASDDVQLAFWLRYAHDQLQWHKAPPSSFWSGMESSDNRLLVALGAPAGVFPFLADMGARAERLWPIRTTNQASISAGRGALPPHHLQALDLPAPTAAALLQALAR